MEINYIGSTIILLRCIRRSLILYLVCCPYGLILVTVKEKKRLIDFSFISNLLFPNSPFFMSLNLFSGGLGELNSYGGRD